ncbi:MAG: hypothetical protein H8F28_06450 [Fibrella sp.]|nr:hypothetical protein [Armatimonadota bacterium]
MKPKLRQLFTAAHTWNGGFYELAIELGLHSDERLRKALQTIWQCDGLDGCYVARDVEPSQQSRLSPSLDTSALGVATLPDGEQVACGTFIVREDNGNGPDWIGFYLPMGALGSVYDVGAFPFVDGKSSRVWREPLDDWLRQIAAAVFVVVPFSLALIGHEVSGTAYADKIRITGVPDERWVGLLWGDAGELIWYPPTRHEGDYTVDR